MLAAERGRGGERSAAVTKNSPLYDSLQPRGLDGGNEELRTVGVGTGVGHAQQSRLGVLELEVLILELVAVDRLATGTVSVGKVTALEHKVGDNSVEGRVGVAETLFAGAESSEVGGGLPRGERGERRVVFVREHLPVTHLGDNVVEQLEGDSTGRSAVDRNVKVTVAAIPLLDQPSAYLFQSGPNSRHC